jgi:peptidoglycan/LPS O-acetylase OafA/YrhL
MNTARDHYNNFNLIRLVAALQVLAVHALNHFDYEGPLVTALKVVPGVPTFFFISGFLICTSYRRMREQGNLAFFTNRFLRIYPALWVCVAVSTIAVALTGYYADREIAPQRFVLWLLGQTTFFQFYNPDFMRPFGVGVLNGALWTISVELQFYLLSPILFYLLENKRRILAIVFGLSLALNLYLRGYLDWSQMYMKLIYVSFAPWIYIFLLGFAAAYFDRITESIKRIRYRVLLPAYLLSMIFVGTYAMNATNAINPISIAILGALILKVSTTALPVPQKLARFVAKSDFSYGLYLYHMPVINLLIFLGWSTGGIDIMLAFAATMLAATLSWYLVEKPALRHKK